MKAYIKSYKEIKKNGREINGYITIIGHYDWPSFVPGMKELCGKGPFEFKVITCFGSGQWYTGARFNWHVSWLNLFIKQLEFEF